MIMTPPLRRLALTAHITVSLGWIGALAVFFAHALAGWLSHDELVVRAVSIAMGITAWFVILPLSLASLATGLVQALGTAWGLLRHYWIVFKLLLTAVATFVLLLKLGPISSLAEAATSATFSGLDLPGLRMSLMIHAGGGLLVLLTVAALAVYRPQGLTPYGMRRQERGGSRTALERTPFTGTPGWARVFGVILIVLVVMLVVMLLGGGHGPGAHLPD